jgi:hypothetical protein
MAGLHDIRPTAYLSIVINATEQPIRAPAEAASIPACPPPTTIISYSLIDLAFTHSDPLIKY